MHALQKKLYQLLDLEDILLKWWFYNKPLADPDGNTNVISSSKVIPFVIWILDLYGVFFIVWIVILFNNMLVDVLLTESLSANFMI